MPLLKRLKRSGLGAHYLAYPLPMFRRSGSVTWFLQTRLSRRGKGQRNGYTEPTGAVVAYLIVSSSVYLVIARSYSTLSNLSIWRNAFLYLHGNCQMWLFIISGLLCCFISCSPKAHSLPVQVTFQYEPNFVNELRSFSTEIVTCNFQRSSSLPRAFCGSLSIEPRTLIQLDQQTGHTWPLFRLLA
jgi:hypothetical protein